MNEERIRNLLTDTCSILNNLFGEKLNHVWLYGSYARGDFDTESDIDVMALVDLSKSELAGYRRQVSDISSELDLKYDALLSIKLQDAETFNRFSSALPYFRNIKEEGISLV